MKAFAATLVDDAKGAGPTSDELPVVQMTLELADRWIWDFWIVDDGDDHHVFYLQAPKSLGDPDLRHWNVSIGHAISNDLNNWTVLDDVFGAGPPGAFDDLSTWTGSAMEWNDGWAMLYTGTSHAERGLVQRIGLATSPDLRSWHRQNDAVLEADPGRYESLDLDMWHDLAWRDPWLVAGPDPDEALVLFTARLNTGDRYDRGVIGRASSPDLRNWRLLEPMPAPTGFGQLEVPQLVQLGRHWYLIFSSDVGTQSAERQRLGAGTGTYYLIGESPDGPFEMIDDGALEADPVGTTYAGRIHHQRSGDPCFLAWDRAGPDGTFVGRLGEARPLLVRSDGALEVAPTQRHT